MDATEICPLTRDAVSELLAARNPADGDRRGSPRRRVARWPFPGTVELWIPEEDGGERYALATSLNLSTDGVGIRSDEELPSGAEVAIAIHEPELSFHGRGVVRHCTAIENEYLVGVQFVYESAERHPRG